MLRATSLAPATKSSPSCTATSKSGSKRATSGSGSGRRVIDSPRLRTKAPRHSLVASVQPA
jgi:hypothetical protein